MAPLRKVIRKATAQDERLMSENRAKENRAFDACQQKIAQHGLDMQLVSAEYVFDGSKILFYFTADERVDFRELVKDLAGAFHTRIELRQIGVRDKAKLVGGLGICGRPFCCGEFLEDFQPVSIKMAKTQNLSLNPTKISGTCGRLMCCLKYEQDTYEALIRSSPKPESFVDTPDGRGTVLEADILRQRVKVQMENDPETISWFANGDIAVLRSGKRPARARQEEAPLLEPIRFRYSTEQIVEEPAPAPQPEQEQRPPRSRRRRGNRPEGREPSEQQDAKQNEAKQMQPAEKNEEPGKEQPEQGQRPPRQRREQRPRKQDKGEARQEKQAGQKQDNREQNREPRPPRPPRKNSQQGSQGNQSSQPSQPAPAQSAQPNQPAAEGETQKPRRRNNYYRHRKPKAPQT